MSHFTVEVEMLRHRVILRHLLAAAIVVLIAAQPVRAQDENDEEEETPTNWTASVHTQYQSNDNSMGVDMSNDLASFQYGAKLEHALGFSLDAGGANLLGTGGGFERWYATFGYSHNVTDWLLFSAELSHYKYQDDSLNAIANLTNTFTVGATFQTKAVNIGISYNTYFGGGSASYYGVNFDRSFDSGDLSINPSLNFSFISQTIDQKRLVSYKKAVGSFGKGMGRGAGKGAAATTTTTSTSTIPSVVTVTGLSGVTLAVALSYDLGSGFSVNAQPTYVNSPKAELAGNVNQFLWVMGITYSKDF